MHRKQLCRPDCTCYLQYAGIQCRDLIDASALAVVLPHLLMPCHILYFHFSGFKFNSAVLEANRDIDDAAGHPAWQDFDVAAMWVKLDELAAAAAAARAAKAARLAAEKQAADKAAATAVEARADTQLPRNATRDDADPAAAGDSAAGESGSATAVAAADKSSGSVKVYVQLKDSAFEKDQKH